MKKKPISVIKTLIFTSLTLGILVLSQIVYVNAVSIIRLAPTRAKVGDIAYLNGTVSLPNGSWTVWFDISNNGYLFDSEDYRASGRANFNATMNVNFAIPSCFGSDLGVNHIIALRDEVAGGYFPYNTAMINFFVITNRDLTTPSIVQAGDKIPIKLTITGGINNTAYKYSIQVTKPDGAASNANLTINSNSTGDASATIIYPDSFPSGQNTNRIGDYKFLFTEITPNNTITKSSTIQVQSTNRTNTSPTATIISIQPNPAAVGTQVTFNGNGYDPDGDITNYKWTSSINGIIGNTSTFSTSMLSSGNHTIYLEVQDNSNAWSNPATATLEIIPKNNTTNRPPTAHLETTPPNSIIEGQQLTLTGYGTDLDGTIVNYIWTSNITGLLSTTNQLDTANLTQGTHLITFQVVDNNGQASDPLIIVLTVLAISPPPSPWPLIIGGTIGISTIILSVSILWLYNRPTSARIKNKLQQKKTQQEEKEQEEEEKEQEKSKRRRIKQKNKPYLVFENADVPSCIMKETTYTSKLYIKNKGIGEATNVKIKAIGNPFIEFKTPMEQIPRLPHGETETASFTFTTNQEIRKNIYQLQFQATSTQTPPKTKKCFMRGGKIALLSDPKKPENADPIRTWLQKSNYPFEDIHNAAHLMTELYNYDLIIVAPEQKMPSRWVQNLCTYIENSQSILLIDKITTRKPKSLNEILGYNQATYNPLNYAQAALEICAEHPVTKGFNIGDQIPLGACTGNACTFTETTATILAKNINQTSEIPEEKSIPAITVKESGKGKIVHLNFHAEEHLDQLNQLVKNAIDWLLW